MVGSAIVRELQRQGYNNIITRTHKELDLTRQEAVEDIWLVWWKMLRRLWQRIRKPSD